MYLLFPLISKSIKKHPHISILVLLFISISSRLLLGQYKLLPKRPHDWFLLCRVFEFGFGVYLANVINRRFFSIDAPKILKSFFALAGELSFPLFLVHYPFLFIIRALPKFGVSQSLAIIFYLIISILASWLILGIAGYIFNKNEKSIYVRVAYILVGFGILISIHLIVRFNDIIKVMTTI